MKRAEEIFEAFEIMYLALSPVLVSQRGKPDWEQKKTKTEGVISEYRKNHQLKINKVTAIIDLCTKVEEEEVLLLLMACITNEDIVEYQKGLDNNKVEKNE